MASEDDEKSMTGTIAKEPVENPPQTEGLTPLDRERAASIADEGGASAAEVEAQPQPTPAPGSTKKPRSTPVKRRK